MPRRSTFSAAAMTLLVCAGPAAQQQQPPTFRSGVELVEVDAVVVDGDGNPVRGLTAGDFVVRDRGRPQTIATFQEVSRDPAPTASPAARPLPVRRDVADNRIPAADRIVVLVVDDLHIYKGRTDRAKTIARRVLTDLGDGSMMAVLFTSGNRSTEVTDDPALLSDALDTLKGRQAWRRPHTASNKQMADRIDPEESLETILAKLQQMQDANLQDLEDNLALFKTLEEAAKILDSAGRRRKAFVLLSEGFGRDLSGLFGAMAVTGDTPQGGVEYATKNDPAATMAVQPTQYHEFALLQMMESMRRANVATYAIDPRGKVASGDLARECFPSPHPGDDPCSEGLTDWNSPVRQAQHGLEMIAAASGGFAVTNTDDFTSGLRRIADDLDHYYVLGFYPAETGGKGYRPLDVAVRGRSDLTIRFRRGYMPSLSKPSRGSKASDPLVGLSSGVLPSTELPLRLAAMPEPGTGHTSRVFVVLEVSAPTAVLEEKDGHLRDTLKYNVLAVDEKKSRARSVAGLEARLSLEHSASAGPLPDAAVYQVAQAVDLAPGRYELRVAATSEKLAKGGSVYLNVDVPDFQAAPGIGGLWIGYADGGHVPLATTRAAGNRSGATVDAPAAIPFAPSLDREFTRADTLRVFAEATARGISHPRVAIDVVDRAGKVVLSPSPSFSSGEVIKVGTTIPLTTLPPGAYAVRASIRDEAGHGAVRETGFVVVR